MDERERAKRFRLARKQYNQHGEQPLRTVEENTHISKSTIQKLEKQDNDTNVGYKDIVDLANYYGVNVAWLMGQYPFDCPSLDTDSQTTARTTGLSLEAIENMERFRHNERLINCLNSILESDIIKEVLTSIEVAQELNRNNKQMPEQAELIERLNISAINGGITASGLRLTNENIIDFYLQKAWTDTLHLYESIVKGDKENGER